MSNDLIDDSLAHNLPKQLDICVSRNSNLVHLEGENCGEQIATINNKGVKGQRIANALEITQRYNLFLDLVAELEFWLPFKASDHNEDRWQVARNLIAKAKKE